MSKKTDTRASEPVTLTAKQNLIQTIKFTLFSASAGIIQITTFTLLNELTNAPEWLSYLVALVLSVLFNFTVNRRFTFKSAANVPIAMLKVFAYYCVFTPLSTFGEDYFTKLGVNEYVVTISMMLLNFITEFLFCRFVVYRNSIYTNDLAQKELAEQEESIEDQPVQETAAPSAQAAVCDTQPLETAEPNAAQTDE